MKKVFLILTITAFLFTMSCAGLKDAENPSPAEDAAQQEEIEVEPLPVEEAVTAAPENEILETEQTQTEEELPVESELFKEEGSPAAELLPAVEPKETAETELENTEEIYNEAETEESPQTVNITEETPLISEIEETSQPIESEETPSAAEIEELPLPAEEEIETEIATEEEAQEPEIETEQELSESETEQEQLAETPEEEIQAEEEPKKVIPLRDALQDSPPESISLKDDAPIPQREEIIFSRTVHATIGQIVEVPFRGNSWVYLGELVSNRGIVFNSRRLDPEGMSFIFKTEKAGNYILKFFKQDFIRDFILNDHVQVIVVEETLDKNSAESAGQGLFSPTQEQARIIAEPRWPSILEKSAILRGGVPAPAAKKAAPQNNDSQIAPNEKTEQTAKLPNAENKPPLDTDKETPQRDNGEVQEAPLPSSTAEANQPEQNAPLQTAAMPKNEITNKTQQSQSTDDNLPPDELLQKAKEAFDKGDTAEAIALLDQYPKSSDEAYWLYGQAYEANTESRNILLALDYYRRLVNEFPQSRRLNNARSRIAYLEKFYINIY